MPLTRKGKRVMRSMMRSYKSASKAKRVFYASANSGKIKGVHGTRARRVRR